jgi:hypothetical protein
MWFGIKRIKNREVIELTFAFTIREHPHASMKGIFELTPEQAEKFSESIAYQVRRLKDDIATKKAKIEKRNKERKEIIQST